MSIFATERKPSLLGRDVSSGKILPETIGQTRTEADFLAHLQQMIRVAPQVKKWHLVMDCLNIHQSESLVRTGGINRRDSPSCIRKKRRIWDSTINGHQGGILE